MQKIIDYLKAHWRVAALVFGGALLVVSAGAFFLLANLHNRSLVVAPPSPENTNVASPVATPRTYTDLYAVSIDNHVDARPASGIDQAAFVYEAPVEGAITRFLAFFERGVQAPKIGPVRSARLYFLDWITSWSAVKFFHFGGSPEAMNKISATPSLTAANVDGATSGGDTFLRDPGQSAPHNAYTSSDNVEKILGGNANAVSVTAWPMANDPDMSARGADGGKVAAPLSDLAAYSPVWVYSSATNLYTRTVGGKVEKTANGATITAKNIVVISTDISVIDTDGRLKITTTGKGDAIIYRNGQTENVTWQTDGTAPPHFYGSDGSEAALTTGNVWIEIIKK